MASCARPRPSNVGQQVSSRTEFSRTEFFVREATTDKSVGETKGVSSITGGTW